ncbi:MAG: bifunctional 5,10-methylenetetrahydrofolate dehydrogenase/5,10-methenyltetrahydrofolate cyclohydrolase, partial [Flavobacteriales bacterium]
MKILDGKTTAEQIKKEIAEEVYSMEKGGSTPPHIAAIIIGEDPPSKTYVNAKLNACKHVGFNSTLQEFPADITQEELMNKIDEFNKSEKIDGYIVQLPLPVHINEKDILCAIDPYKDIDGLHPYNVGRMMLNMKTILPATPYGILQLIKRYRIETFAKHCVVMGRSTIVGSPMSILMKRNTVLGNSTVTLTHKYTRNWEKHAKSADILITAVGKPGMIKAEHIKEGAVVFDVGITRVKDDTKKNGYKITGDIDFDSVSNKCSYITPVPGGVGPMTIASLLKNSLFLSKIHRAPETQLESI